MLHANVRGWQIEKLSVEVLIIISLGKEFFKNLANQGTGTRSDPPLALEFDKSYVLSMYVPTGRELLG